MATLYLDFEGGSDAADGTSFANRFKTITSGATAARIAPGDTIRIMGSPAPTSLGINGTWTTGPLPSTKTVTSTTNATPIVVTSTAHGYSNGDTVQITGVSAVNALGVWEIANKTADTFELVNSVGSAIGGSGAVRNITNCRVTLASALTQNIASTGNRGTGRVAWTASANVTSTLNTTDTKEGDVSDSQVIAAGFGTGLASYVATGLLDLSTYKQVSFWIKQTIGTTAVAGDITLELCSDTIGAVSVQSIAIPALGANNLWHQFTVDIGGALPAIVNSIALYVGVDRGAQTFLLSNIIADKDSTSADSLSLTSLLGKNTAGETWYGIQSINGTRVMLDNQPGLSVLGGTTRGYTGTTETVTTYKRETIKTGVSGTHTIQDSGTSGSPITFSGGWNRTDMSTQTLETWWDGQNGAGTLTASAKSYLAIENMGLVRYSVAWTSTTTTDSTFSFLALNNNTSVPFNNNNVSLRNTYTISALNNNGSTADSSGYGTTLTITQAHNNAVSAFNMGTSQHLLSLNAQNNNASALILSGFNSVAENITASGNGGADISITGDRNVVRVATCTGTGTNVSAITASVSNNNRIYSLTSSNHSTSGVSITTGRIYLFNANISDSTEFSGGTAGSNARIISINHDGTDNNHLIYTDGATIISNDSVGLPNSTISWEFLPTSATRSATYPVDLTVANVPVAANVEVTFSLSFRRSHANMIGVLRLSGDQLSGIASDVTDTTTGATDTFEELTVTATPTQAGVLKLEAYFYANDGVTTYSGYIDGFSMTPSYTPDTGSLDVGFLEMGPFVGYQGQASAGVVLL